jgi:pimeloyl-ACP methyl ester carboxylesterase
MQPQARKVSLPTGELSYFVAGEGRPIVYLHPAGGVRWTRVLEGLAKSFAVHVPVMPGFDGTNAHGAVKSMQRLARLMGEFIDKVVGGPSDVMGCSFGGCVALWLAAERPDRVDHLVLECPAVFRPKGSRPADAEAMKKLLFLHPEKLPPESKPAEQEAANRGMLRTTRTPICSRRFPRSTSSPSSFTAPPTGWSPRKACSS